MLDAILFDLDGTLLPMRNDTFIKAYMKLLTEKAAPLGYAPERVVQALWEGVGSIVKNDGTKTNFEAFWETFAAAFDRPEQVMADIPVFHRFYSEEFQKAKAVTDENPLAREAVMLARKKAGKVILATTPQFPLSGIVTRLGWVGLSAEDFDDITDYENWSYSKPNPQYFTAIAQKHGLIPARCLMIGNDTGEDIAAAKTAGMQTFLVTDHLEGGSADGILPQGTFSEMLVYLKAL